MSLWYSITSSLYTHIFHRYWTTEIHWFEDWKQICSNFLCSDNTANTYLNSLHPGGLQKSILEDPEAAMSMSELNVAYRMSVDEYQEKLQRDVHGKNNDVLGELKVLKTSPYTLEYSEAFRLLNWPCFVVQEVDDFAREIWEAFWIIPSFFDASLYTTLFWPRLASQAALATSEPSL